MGQRFGAAISESEALSQRSETGRRFSGAFHHADDGRNTTNQSEESRPRKRQRLDPQQVEEIKANINATPSLSLGTNKAKNYRTILDRNEASVAAGQDSWDSRSMEKAAGINTGSAARIRAGRQPETLGTVAIKTDINAVPGLSLDTNTAAENYHTILDHNEARVAAGQDSWNDRSMQKAAGVRFGGASMIRAERQPETPHMAAIKADINAVPHLSLGTNATAPSSTATRHAWRQDRTVGVTAACRRLRESQKIMPRASVRTMGKTQGKSATAGGDQA